MMTNIQYQTIFRIALYSEDLVAKLRYKHTPLVHDLMQVVCVKHGRRYGRYNSDILWLALAVIVRGTERGCCASGRRVNVRTYHCHGRSFMISLPDCSFTTRDMTLDSVGTRADQWAV